MVLTHLFVDLRLLGRLHGLARSLEIPFLNTHIRPSFQHSAHRILHVHFYLLAEVIDVDLTFNSWDTSMSQKSRFKMQTQGIHTFRNTFPQLPGGTLKNPTYIQTAHGYVSIASVAKMSRVSQNL